MIQNPQYVRRHSCRVYIDSFENHFNIEKLIDKVVFKLHSSFRNPEFVTRKAPFEFKCTVWGYFNIPIHIHFKEWTGLGVVEIDHLLCIQGTGRKSQHSIEVEKEKIPVGFFWNNSGNQIPEV